MTWIRSNPKVEAVIACASYAGGGTYSRVPSPGLDIPISGRFFVPLNLSQAFFKDERNQ